MTNTYDKTIRKWIHKFNDNGIEGLFTKIDYSPMVKIDNDTRDYKNSIYKSKGSGIKILYLVTEITY